MDAEDVTRTEEIGTANNNLGGTRTTIYYMDASLMPTGNNWPANPADMSASNAIALADLDSAITAGDMAKVDVVLHTGSVDDEQVGGEGGYAWMSKLSFDFAKNTALKLGFLRTTTNGRLVFFVPCNDGNIRIVGNDICPATRPVGTNRTNKKQDDTPAAGSSQEWVAYGSGPALILTDDISDLEALLTA